MIVQALTERQRREKPAETTETEQSESTPELTEGEGEKQTNHLMAFFARVKN